MIAKKPVDPSTEELQAAVSKLAEQTAKIGLPTRRRKRLECELRGVSTELGKILRDLDPVTEPIAVFNPSNPKLIGRFVALALVAQDRLKLSCVPLTYGSGIYAIYYKGPFGPYEAISGSETPIYVGTASPAIPNARTPYEQGTRLADRITFHAKNITKAASTLSIEDFEFRSIVIQSGWEKQAESYLIHLSKPVWNKETRIVGGFGKHGDSAEMRKHGRSPWDTLHPARAWAGGSAGDQKTYDQIIVELKRHFKVEKIYRSVDEILAEFVQELRLL